jgi:hypothetical protein
MTEPSWSLLTTVFDTISAQVLVERLEQEGVSTRLRTDTPILGMARKCEIYVPSHRLEHARSLIATEPLSDAELTDLATGRRD